MHVICCCHVCHPPKPVGPWDLCATCVRCPGAHKGPDGVRLATRSMLLLAAYCQETGAHAEANYALMRAHFQARPRGFVMLAVDLQLRMDIGSTLVQHLPDERTL